MIIFKYLVKNIFEKPFRTLLLIFCMGSCVLAGLFGMDIISSMDGLLKAMLMQVTGTTDLIVGDSVGVDAPFSLSCENTQLLLYETSGAEISFADGEYTYFHRQPFSINTMDYAVAARLCLVPKDMEIADDEAVMNPAMQRRNGYQVGDKITLYDDYGDAHDYKIKSVLPAVGLGNGTARVFLSTQGFAQISSESKAKTIYVDVADDEKLSVVKNEIEELRYSAEVQELMGTDAMKEEMKMLKTLFATVFLVGFFLVIFVSFSISNRIVCERMAVVGTFRSLGLSGAFTTKILLLENALYGVLGALCGIIFYLSVRDAVFANVLQVSASQDMEIAISTPPVSVVNCIVVLIMAVVVMMACPMKSILATSKTAIRDIIFDNKDTAYKTGRAASVTGIVCLLVAVFAVFMKDNVIAQIICFCAMMIAVALLFPYVLKFLAGLFGSFFEKRNMPVARLAALETYARKSTVGSSVLCVTASTLSLVIFIFVSTLGSIYDIHPYQGDVVVCPAERKASEYFSYIKDLDGVTGTEELYCKDAEVSFGEKKRNLTVFGLPEDGFDLFVGIKDCPDAIAEDEFVMDEGLARKLSLAVGDEVEVHFNSDSFLPISKKLRLAAVANGYGYDTTGDVMVISKSLYVSIYHDYPGKIIIACEHPEETVKQIENYSSSMVESVSTMEEINADWKSKESGLRGMMLAIICFGVGLTTIGMVSNQLIGFEGRKRECAVLSSVAMTGSQIGRMFLLESALASLAALLLAFPMALVTFIPLKRIIISLSGTFVVSYNIPLYILFEVALWLVFTLVALFPIGRLRKMRIAEQLKYE